MANHPQEVSALEEHLQGTFISPPSCLCLLVLIFLAKTTCNKSVINTFSAEPSAAFCQDAHQLVHTVGLPYISASISSQMHQRGSSTLAELLCCRNKPF